MQQHFSGDQETACPSLSRREVLGGGLLLGLAALGGCAKRQTAMTPSNSVLTAGTVQPYLPPVVAAPATTPSGPAISVSSAVPIVPRSMWTTVGPLMGTGRSINRMGSVNRITIHHEGDVVFTATSQGSVAQRLESIRQYHITRMSSSKPGEKWADIGYHYIIDPAGRVWEGRSVSWQGAHVKNQNENNLGVMVMGNFDLQRPTPQALGTLDAFVTQQMRRFNVSRSRVYTHRELNPTECPGTNLQTYMVKTRSRGGRLAMAAEQMGLA
jgi:hypothetical protein